MQTQLPTIFVEDVDFNTLSPPSSPRSSISDFSRRSTTPHTDVDDVHEDKERDIGETIALYGDSFATDWHEERYKVWELPQSYGSTQRCLVGYLVEGGYAFVWGTPACPKERLVETLLAFIEWCRSQSLSPMLLCVNEAAKDIILSKMRDWVVFTCVREEVLDPSKNISKEGGYESPSRNLRSVVRRAQRAGAKVQWYDEGCLPSADVVEEVNDGLAAWLKARKGPQIASDSLDIWIDYKNRRYFVARDEQTGRAVGVANLARCRGGREYQIKNFVSFPWAPKGTSELLVEEAITAVSQLPRLPPSNPSGDEEDEETTTTSTTVTFGGSADDELRGVHNLSGWKFQWLSKVYQQIVKSFGLTKRHAFRSKWHAQDRPLYIAYPSEPGMSLGAARSLLRTLNRT